MRSLLLGFMLLLNSAYQESVEEMLIGKWTYLKGSYEYYDSANRKLKQSDMNAISSLDIQISKEAATIIYSKGKSTTSSYSVAKGESGRYLITANLSGHPFNYEISSISSSELILLSKHNTSFTLDGDPTKKASYCIVKIYLAKK